MPVLIGATGVCVVWLLTTVGFGSLDNVFAWANRYAVVVSPTVSEFDIEPGRTVDVLFDIRSLVNRHVKIVGATTGCNCVAVLGLPLDLTDGTADWWCSFPPKTTSTGNSSNR
jgi:hypothetical protein